MAKLKGVLIGCGAIAREHLAAMGEIENAEIAAVCDLSPAKAEAAAERFRVPKWSTNYCELLDEIRPELVHITSPPSSHFPIARECLAAGFNVLCEKPIVADFKDFKLLQQIAVDKRCMFVENQNFRFHSSIKRIQNLIDSGALGEVLNLQLDLALHAYGPGNPYIDRNAPHFSMQLRGGVAGDFLSHIAYLARMFIGPTIGLRTSWKKFNPDSPFHADEFRGLIKGERATAYVSFSANSRPNGFWLRVAGTKMHAEANLYEPPRLTLRRARSGEPALMTLIDGLSEASDVLKGSLAGFWRKLAGTGSYDGLPEFIARTYRALEMNEAPPVSLEELEQIVLLVDQMSAIEFTL